jgi:hypothetical protein
MNGARVRRTSSHIGDGCDADRLALKNLEFDDFAKGWRPIRPQFCYRSNLASSLTHPNVSPANVSLATTMGPAWAEFYQLRRDHPGCQL